MNVIVYQEKEQQINEGDIDQCIISYEPSGANKTITIRGFNDAVETKTIKAAGFGFKFEGKNAVCATLDEDDEVVGDLLEFGECKELTVTERKRSVDTIKYNKGDEPFKTWERTPGDKREIKRVILRNPQKLFDKSVNAYVVLQEPKGGGNVTDIRLTLSEKGPETVKIKVNFDKAENGEVKAEEREISISSPVILMKISESDMGTGNVIIVDGELNDDPKVYKGEFNSIGMWDTAPKKSDILEIKGKVGDNFVLWSDKMDTTPKQMLFQWSLEGVIPGGGGTDGEKVEGHDRFLIPYFHKSKTNGFNYEMSDNPKNDIAMDVLDKHYKVSNQGGVTVITMKPDGPTSLGVGRNVRGEDDSIGGCNQNFKEVEKLGHTYKEDDVRDLEYKCIMKIKGLGKNGFSMSACTGRHPSDSDPCCQGNAYMFNIEDPSASPVTFRFRKEMWHASYHNSPEDIWTHDAVPKKLDGADWFGFGFCRYNTPNKQGHVTLEAWLCPPGKDFTKKENWTMLKRIEDFNGNGWGDDGDVCHGAKDQALTWSGRQNRLKTNATSGSVDFKCVTFREIDPSSEAVSKNSRTIEKKAVKNKR